MRLAQGQVHGISWQIVPAHLGELMSGEVRALMEMKKIVIDELVNAD